MSPLVPIMMFGWIPIVIGLFSKLPPRRAVISAFLFAWLFLPMASYPISGLPDYTKMSATCCGIFISAALFDAQRLLSFKFRIIDLPMIMWCLCPIASSLSNGLGLYDGVSTALTQTVTWGFPYFIGRIYFSDLDSLQEYAIGIFIGGLIYTPFCWYEIRMSPQLHNMFYGFMQHDFSQTYRYGGWRPMVFMQHGLMVGAWMVSGSLIGLWLWISGTIKQIWGIPIKWLVLFLICTAVMCKSTGAVALFIMGAGILFMTKVFKKKIMVICLLLIPVLYLSTRAPGFWDGDNLALFAYNNFDEDRAISLYTRFDNENILREKARLRPVFGWGGWGRNRVYNEEGIDITVTDSLWIIIFGTTGLVGLSSLTTAILLPMMVLMRRYPVKEWFQPQLASVTVLAVLLGLYMVDNLLNAMINPIFMVAAGGISGLIKESLAEDFIKAENEPWMGTIYCPRFL